MDGKLHFIRIISKCQCVEPVAKRVCGLATQLTIEMVTHINLVRAAGRRGSIIRLLNDLSSVLSSCELTCFELTCRRLVHVAHKLGVNVRSFTDNEARLAMLTAFQPLICTTCSNVNLAYVIDYKYVSCKYSRFVPDLR